MATRMAVHTTACSRPLPRWRSRVWLSAAPHRWVCVAAVLLNCMFFTPFADLSIYANTRVRRSRANGAKKVPASNADGAPASNCKYDGYTDRNPFAIPGTDRACSLRLQTRGFLHIAKRGLASEEASYRFDPPCK